MHKGLQALNSEHSQIVTLRKGLLVRTAQINTAQHITTDMCALPGLKLALVVDGCADFAFNGLDCVLGKTLGTDKNTGALINLVRPELCVQHCQPQTYAKTLSVYFSHDWLLQSLQNTPAQRLNILEQHLSVHMWEPSKKALVIAQQILLTPVSGCGVPKLFLESRCIELISEALLSLLDSAPHCAGAMISPDERLIRAKALLDNCNCEPFSLQAIAERVGMSISSLQRHFQRHFHISVAQYHRQQRLKRAIDALKNEHITIGQAADLAGYSNTANFSTAVKKEYGATPKQLQNTL